MENRKTKEDFINKSTLEFKDISSEAVRTYVYPDMEIRIELPLWLNVNSKSGGHRVFSEYGISHYIPAGWKHLYWEAKPGEANFTF